MRAVLHTLARGLGFLLSTLFVLGMPLALIAWDGGQILFNPYKVNALLDDAVLRSQLIPQGMAWVARQQAARISLEPDMPDYTMLVDALTLNEWQLLRGYLLSDETLLDYTRSIAFGYDHWLNIPDPTPDITLFTEPLRRNLQGVNGQKALELVYNTLPACTQTQIDDFKQRQAKAQHGQRVYYNLCHFPSPWEADQKADYLASVQDVADSVPATLALTDTLPFTAQTYWQVKLALLQARTISRFGWLLAIGLLWLIAALCVRSFQDLGRWWGIPLALSGVLGFTLTITLPAMGQGWFSYFTALLPRALAEEIVALLDATLRLMLRPMWWQSALLFLGGLLLFAGTWWHARQHAEAAS